MRKESIQQVVLEVTNTKEAIRSSALWIKCGKPRKNDFYNILHEMINMGWLRKTKQGIIRIDFTKEDDIPLEKEWVRKWSRESRAIIAKNHKPLMKTTKKGIYYLTKKAQEDLYTYFYECDYHTLNVLNRNFIVHRLKLISPSQYKKNAKAIEELFDYLLYGLINDHKSFKKQIIERYLATRHALEFRI